MANLGQLDGYERLLLLNRLAVAWTDPLDGPAAARQVATNVTRKLGFDFATVSLVDAEHRQICTEAGSNAGWVEEARHDLTDDDVQCRVVRDGESIINDGSYEPYLDRTIWERHRHARTTRIWVPIKQPHGKGPDRVFGTIEAGFYHRHRREITPELRVLLEDYAAMVFPVLLNARQQTRNQKLVSTLEKLNAVGDRLNQQADTLGPDAMARLIGRCAEAVLDANLVMVFLPHKGRKRPKLVYMTDEPASGLLAEDRIRITPYLSEALDLKLSSDRGPYFSPNAQEDPVLVRFGLDGLPDGRSFTQRHGIRSFAGVPLITKAGAIIGYLCLNYLVHHEFYPEIRQLVHLFAEQAAAALLQTRQQRLALAVAIEHERSEMAAIVHNRLSGGLATDYTLALTAVEYARSCDPRLMEKLQELLLSIDQNKRELRQLLVEVRGVEALPVDLARGVEARVKISKELQRGPVSLDARVDPLVVIPPRVARAVLNVLREALSNAETHARGSSVNVTFQVDAQDGIELRVEDNGPGFDQEHLPEQGRNGLFSLQVFAGQIGVPLTLRSSPGKGTLVGIQVPREVMEDHHD